MVPASPTIVVYEEPVENLLRLDSRSRSLALRLEVSMDHDGLKVEFDSVNPALNTISNLEFDNLRDLESESSTGPSASLDDSAYFSGSDLDGERTSTTTKHGSPDSTSGAVACQCKGLRVMDFESFCNCHYYDVDSMSLNAVRKPCFGKTTELEPNIDFKRLEGSMRPTFSISDFDTENFDSSLYYASDSNSQLVQEEAGIMSTQTVNESPVENNLTSTQETNESNSSMEGSTANGRSSDGLDFDAGRARDKRDHEELCTQNPGLYEDLDYHVHTGIDTFLNLILGNIFALDHSKAPFSDYKRILEALIDELLELAEAKGYEWDEQRDGLLEEPAQPGNWRFLNSNSEAVLHLKADPNKYPMHDLVFQALAAIGVKPSTWCSAVALSRGRFHSSDLASIYQLDFTKIPLLMRVYANETLRPQAEALADGLVEMAKVLGGHGGELVQ